MVECGCKQVDRWCGWLVWMVGVGGVWMGGVWMDGVDEWCGWLVWVVGVDGWCGRLV